MIRIMNTLNKNKSGAHTPLKRLVYLLTLCGFTTSSLGGTFPTTPLHLQDETTTTSVAGVKPNVMFFIDDSGSMQWNTWNSDTPNANNDNRMMIVQRALNKLLVENKDNINWGIQTLHNNKRTPAATTTNKWGQVTAGRDREIKSWFGVGENQAFTCQTGNSNYINSANITPKDNKRKHFTDDYELIRKHIACLSPGGGTPANERARVVVPYMVDSDNLKNRCQKSYLVMLSDGDASDSGQLSDLTMTRYNNDQKTSGKDAYGVSWNDFTAGSPPIDYSKQMINTFTIGFGSGLSKAGKKFLDQGASCIYTPPDAKPGEIVTSPPIIPVCKAADSKYLTGDNKDRNFYDASDSDSLTSAFDAILASINRDNPRKTQEVFSATSPAISSNYVDGLAAAATLHTGSWSSEIVFYDVDANGRLDTDKPKRATFGNRKVLISNGTDVHLYSNNMSGSNNTWYDIAANGTKNTNEWRDGLLKWMARDGDDASIKSNNPNFVLDYRTRPLATTTTPDQRSMGDIIDNSILAIGEMKDKRQEFVVTSTNDGMVYVFQSQNSTTNPYDLKFNYAPAKMERSSNDGSDYVGKYYQDTTREKYGDNSKTNPHRYLLNGGMVARSTDANGQGKQIFLASNMGQAGRGAFAINIGGVNRQTGAAIAANNVTQNNWHNDVKLFETPSGTTNQLGFTIGSPQVGRVQVDTNSTAVKNDTSANIHYGVFVSNGYNYKSDYNNTNADYADTPALYVYEGLGQDVGLAPTTGNYTKGEVLKKLDVPGGTGGLGTPTLVDVNFDGVIDYAYAGDFGGGLYRFNFLSPNPNNWTATKIFQTAARQPITAAPAVFRNSADKYTVIAGTGSEIYQEDLAAKDQQSLYGIFDDLTLEGSAAQVADYDLLTQTLSSQNITNSAGTVEIRKSSDNAIVADRHKGWKIDFDASNGERITVKPSIMGNSVLLATRIYEQEVVENTGDDPCLDQTKRASSSAYSWLMQFNTSNGGLIPADNKSVYIDFNLGNDARFGSSSTQQYMISGQKLKNLTSITLIDRAVEGYSASTSGDSGGSGEDMILNPNAKIPKNTCVGDGSKAFTFDTGGDSETYHIFGACRDDSTAVYQRLSWREIF